MLDINDFPGGGESQDKTMLTNYGYKYFKAMLFSAQFTFLKVMEITKSVKRSLNGLKSGLNFK